MASLSNFLKRDYDLQVERISLSALFRVSVTFAGACRRVCGTFLCGTNRSRSLIGTLPASANYVFSRKTTETVV